MPLFEYRCSKCFESIYAFPEDKDRISSFESGTCKSSNHEVERLAPKARCVHMTEVFMLSQFDSIETIHELNSKLMKEAEQEREDRQYQAARKEM